MRRQLIGAVLITMLLTGGALQAQAAEQTGIIRVNMNHGATSATEAAVSLYHIGYPSQEGYRLSDSFGGGLIRREDIEFSDLAQWLSENVTWEGENQYLQEDGTAEFTDLREGLYLLVQTETVHGFLQAAPFLVPIPCNGMWEVTALPKMQELVTESPQTGQHPAPIIGAMGLVLSGMGLVVCLEKIRKK